MTIEQVIKLHRIADKMGMATKCRLVNDDSNLEESRDALTRRVRDAVRAEYWEGAAASISILLASGLVQPSWLRFNPARR